MEWDLMPQQVYVAWDLNSCREAYAKRRLREWIEAYLIEPDWENLGLLRRVKQFSVYWPAPVLMPISAMERVTGPGPEFKFPQDPDVWNEAVNAIVTQRPQPDELPPVICWRDPDGVINLADGNHRVEALERLGYEYAWALVHDGPLRSEEELRQREEPVKKTAPPKQVKGELSDLAERFRIFSGHCEGSSELYQYLSAKIAEDEEMLEIARMSQPGQPEPNLLLGAVHHLLINGAVNPLCRYYPSISLEPESPDLAFPAFRKFVQSHEEEVIELLQTKLVQTNEVQRSAYLFPAIQTISRLFGEKPLFCIELGPSAGFNLLWDQYQYRYDGSDLEGSSIILESSFRGDRKPELSSDFPTVTGRVGIDLNPIDLMNRDQVKWLQALIWPEHFDRKARLIKAVRIAMINPVTMIQGHAVDVLPSVLLDVPRTEVAMVYHTHVANQMSPEEREELLQVVDDFGQQQDIVHLHNNIEPHLHATIYRDGERIEMPIAKTDGHARWIEWLV